MYECLKDWINVPLTVKPFLKRDGTGDKLFKEPITVSCYPVSEIKTVRNVQGADVISSCQLFVDGSAPISKLDNIVFEGLELPVQSIQTFYRDGVPDLKVVYV